MVLILVLLLYIPHSFFIWSVYKNDVEIRQEDVAPQSPSLQVAWRPILLLDGVPV